MFEDCRRMGHAWEDVGGPPLGRENLRRDIWLRCTRCAMVRAFDIAPTGEALWPRYFPPEGYYWQDRTAPAPTKADYRIGWLREVIARRGGARRG